MNGNCGLDVSSLDRNREPSPVCAFKERGNRWKTIGKAKSIPSPSQVPNRSRFSAFFPLSTSSSPQILGGSFVISISFFDLSTPPPPIKLQQKAP
ncbi:hypothetical protein POX_b03224 [Penicillium oxalicum]|uniref:hypothetical protein n=1 Tax=Penicillium oxalicum TaxID=69781 RepID=UPI0020B65A8C|nr:hypothetical protein POX_b03224 [Penicillium oxalicum]KAI2793174.1 hypothetical protein POX_b03224 [Penicillium oxalicum]